MQRRSVGLKLAADGEHEPVEEQHEPAARDQTDELARRRAEPAGRALGVAHDGEAVELAGPERLDQRADPDLYSDGPS